MKLVPPKKIKYLRRYYEKKGILKTNPKILAVLITEEEHSYIINSYKQIEKNAKENNYKIPDYDDGSIKTHLLDEFFPNTAISCTLVKKGMITTILRRMYEVNNFKNFNKFKHAIILRKERFKDDYRYLKIPKDKINPSSLSYALHLIHEYTHVVERESGIQILPEDNSFKIVLVILKDLPKEFMKSLSNLKISLGPQNEIKISY